MTFFDHFYPAVRVGGPAKSSLGFVQHLGDKFNIKIFTSCYDYGESEVLNGIKENTLLKRNQYYIFYAAKRDVVRNLINSFNNFQPDILYLNSIFSFKFSILPLLLLKLRILPETPIILAPRGELNISALNTKKHKKSIYLFIFSLLFSSKISSFQATNSFEQGGIKKVFPKIPIHIAENFKPIISNLMFESTLKQKYKLKVILVSRIHPIKNILYAIEVVLASSINITLDIYGFLEDKSYWEKCLEKILESNGRINYLGELLSEDVMPTIQRYDLFFLPTQGENFGHVILEAFLASRPVLISDQTPWIDLAKLSSGAELPLDNQSAFVNILEKFAEMSSDDYDILCQQAFKLGAKEIMADKKVEQYLNLFDI